MALIRATCSECGDIELRSRDLTVRTCIDSSAKSQYHFRCPVCRMTEVKVCDDGIVKILVNAGVKRIEWSLPIELREPRIGPKINHDDCIGFYINYIANHKSPSLQQLNPISFLLLIIVYIILVINSAT